MSLQTPILITGCARSGTSLTAGIINLCGAWGGDVAPANSNNKKGMFENKIVREQMIKQYLRSIGVDPLGQNPLPKITDIKPRPDWGQRFASIMQEQGYENGPVFYKGAKICLVWPVWGNAFPGSKYVIVRRKDDQIIKSCFKTGFMRAYRDVIGWQGWIDIHKQRFEEMALAGLQVKEFWPETVFEGNLEPLKELIDWLGLTWNEQAVQEFIDPSLYSRSK